MRPSYTYTTGEAVMFRINQLSRRPMPVWLGVGAMLTVALATVPRALTAAQLADGTTMFDSPPRLVSFVTTRDRTNDSRATYYVTVDLLPEAGEPLRTLEVALIEGRFRQLGYRLDDVVVFQGDRGDRGETIPVESATYDDATQTLTVRLATAAEPGQLVTFALSPNRNPARGGVYLFEVTAAPEGEQPVSQRVGTGRLNIFRPDGNDPFD